MQGIYLSAKNNTEGFRLPVNPEKIKVVGNGSGEEFSIAKTGKVNIPKDIALDQYSFESFFPAQPYSFMVTGFLPPSHYLDLINTWRAEKVTPRFMYVDGSFTINELVTIESFEYDETAGSEDVNFSISLKRFVPFEPKKMTVVKKPATTAKKPVQVVKKTAPPRETKRDIPQTYVLIPGDSLWKVAQKYYKDGTRAYEIQRLNGIKDSQLRKLPIGLKIKLPPK